MATTSDPRWSAAAAELNAGRYHEAHEIWESLWNDAEGDEKVLCQALLQIAAAYAKLDVGEVNGARKLLERGLARLQQAGPQAREYDGLQISAAAALQRLRSLPRGASVGLDAVPRPRL